MTRFKNEDLMEDLLGAIIVTAVIVGIMYGSVNWVSNIATALNVEPTIHIPTKKPKVPSKSKTIMIETVENFRHDVNISNDIIQCMATNLYHEARGATIVEQQAVLKTVMASAEYRNISYCEEIRRPYRYSWTLKNNIPINDLKAWRNVVEVTIATITYGSDNWTGEYYHDYSVNPKWNRNMKVVLKGKQLIFYTERGKT